MNEMVRRCIERIYKQNDTDYYLSRCRKPVKLPRELEALFDNPAWMVIDVYKNDVWPSDRWKIDFEDITFGDHVLSLKTKLLISRLVPVFYVQHEFEMEVNDDRLITPVLDGFGPEAYSKMQFEFHERVSQILKKEGFQELSFAEMNEVVCALSFKEGVTLFGNQVTVEYALFYDILELCPD